MPTKVFRVIQGNEFYLNLLKEQLHLTEQEFKVCVLARLHFIPSEMSCLLNLSQQRITNIRSAVNYKLFQIKWVGLGTEKKNHFPFVF